MHLQEPKISVIIPVYNLGKKIEKTLQSIGKQGYDNLQIIIVNDGSKDDSLAICRQFAADDSRIEIIDQQNTGLAIARKNGLKAATGDYIHHLDGGDYLADNAYQQLVERLQSSHFPDMLFFGFYFNNNIKLQPSSDYPAEVKKPIDFLRHIWATQQYNAVWQYLHKRELATASEIDFNEKLTLGEDAYYTTQVVQRSSRIEWLPERLLYYDISEESMSSCYSDKAVESMLLMPRLVNKYMEDKPEYNELKKELITLKLVSYVQFIRNSRTENLDEMCREFWEAFKLYPELKKTGLIKTIYKLLFLYRIHPYLYELQAKRYRKKGKIR